jgi:hypothetical protein
MTNLQSTDIPLFGLSTSEWTSHHRQNRTGPLLLSEREVLCPNYLDRPLYLDVRPLRHKVVIGVAETRSLRPFAMLLQPHTIDRSELLQVGAAVMLVIELVMEPNCKGKEPRVGRVRRTRWKLPLLILRELSVMESGRKLIS